MGPDGSSHGLHTNLSTVCLKVPAERFLVGDLVMPEDIAVVSPADADFTQSCSKLIAFELHFATRATSKFNMTPNVTADNGWEPILDAEMAVNGDFPATAAADAVLYNFTVKQTGCTALGTSCSRKFDPEAMGCLQHNLCVSEVSTLGMSVSIDIFMSCNTRVCQMRCKCKMAFGGSSGSGIAEFMQNQDKCRTPT